MLNFKKKKLSNKFIIIIIIVIILILLTIFSYTLNSNRKLNKFESLIKDSVTSVSNVVTYPFKFIVNTVTDFIDLKNVEEENDNLKTSLDRIEAIETENIELRRQLEVLKKDLNIEYTLNDYEYLNSTVTSRNTLYWFNTITLNKGKYAGIENDMVVINSKGVVGKVIKTTAFTSQVRLLTTTDTNNKISVSIISNGNKLNGLISKYDSKTNTLEVEGISNTETVSIGDYVYTSGMGGIFPSGLLIGTVSNITTDSYDLSKIIKVIPSVNFDDLNYVSILKRKDSHD